MFERFQKPVVILVLLAWSCVTLGMPAQMVLCYGADGHVAVETPHDLCKIGEPVERSLNTAPASTVASRQPCTDVPVAPHVQLPPTTAPQQRVGVLDLPLDLLFAAVLDSRKGDTITCRTALVVSSHFHLPSDLLHLRSVILLV